MGGISGVRYFRSTDAVYQIVCAQLDAAYGYPNAQTKTLRALPLTQDMPHGPDGSIYVAISSDYCEFILPSQMIPQLLESGAAEELTKAQYEIAVPPLRPA